MKPLAPGATIGILGGGQLGRMLSIAAAQLGFDVAIFTDEPDSPAARVSARTTIGNYLDHAALADFARRVDVVTTEFENVPAETAQAKPARAGRGAGSLRREELFRQRRYRHAAVSRRRFAS